jgi:thioredoxin 1
MIEATSASFDADVLQSTLPVLVDFWAPWCGPCKALGPTFESLAAEYEGRATFIKVNIDDTDIAQRYGVRGVPTLMMFKEGAVVGTQVGNVPKSKIAFLVESHL